jgi:hypothetical protein
MRCPKCGAENPDNAEFCATCNTGLAPGEFEGDTYQAPGEVGAGMGYRAPGEWRGGDKTIIPVHKVAERKFSKLYVKIAVYGVVFAALAAWLALSFTVWGNPDPEERSHQLLEAVNERDVDDFCRNVLPSRQDEGKSLYQEVALYLGEGGKFKGVDFEVEQSDTYTARTRAKRGLVEGAFGERTIDDSSGIVIMLENQKGVWYVNPLGTDLLP